MRTERFFETVPVGARPVSDLENLHGDVDFADGENERTVWDDSKNAINIQRRAIDFAGLDAAFDGRFAVTVEDLRRDYGEPRFNRLVALNGVVLNVTFTPRGQKHRIISARLASRKERRIYDARKQD